MIITPNQKRVRYNTANSYDLTYTAFKTNLAPKANISLGESSPPIAWTVPPLSGLEIIEVEVYGTFNQASGSSTTIQYVLTTDQFYQSPSDTFGNLSELASLATNANACNFKFNAIIAPEQIDNYSPDGLLMSSNSTPGKIITTMYASRSAQTAVSNKNMTVFVSDMQQNSSIDMQRVQEIRFMVAASAGPNPTSTTTYVNSSVKIYSPNWI